MVGYNILIINIILYLIFVIITLIITSPFVIMIMFGGFSLWFSLFYPIALFLIFALLLIFTTLLVVYQNAAWTLLFLKLNQTKLYSKLERLTIIDVQKQNPNIIKKK